MGPGGGEIGSAIGQFAGKALNYPMMYIELYKQYRKERLAREKTASKEESSKEKAAKVKLQKVTYKMTPQEKQQTKIAITKREKQNQPRKPWWMQDSVKTAKSTKPTMGQTAQGSDGNTYTYKGQQWVSDKGAIKRKNVTISTQ